LPGVGQQLVLAAQTRDYPLVLGVVIVYATLIIFLNLAADILYGVLDPRARRA
jgi:oligopeptide transport system permease protein